ncbi:hypothetical protein KC338_g188 [Hortaea werneckii]|nr:hypothetical protein KC338_g188 [Hortaea werneckii]
MSVSTTGSLAIRQTCAENRVNVGRKPASRASANVVGLFARNLVEVVKRGQACFVAHARSRMHCIMTFTPIAAERTAKVPMPNPYTAQPMKPHSHA